MYILASASPRRIELIKRVLKHEEFEVIPASINEVVKPGLTPKEVAEDIAYQKALVVAGEFPNKTIISADTVVAYHNEILGKPESEYEAFNMLKKLNGTSHYVYTGFCIMKGSKFIVGSDKTIVVMKRLSDDSLKSYIKDFNPLDKAGAYGIQDNVVVDTFQGSHDNVVGLPVDALIEALKHFEKLED